MKAVYGRGAKFVPVSLGTNFGDREVLTGRYGCFNCSSTTGYYAFLVIALGVLIFGVYATKQRRQSSRLPGAPKEEKILVDEEGWESKISEEERRAALASKDEKGWETKRDG